MWSQFDHWQTGTFGGFPELSNRSFAHVYENAPPELLEWVLGEGQRAGIRWVWDFARYVYRRSKAEGGLGHRHVCPPGSEFTIG